MKSLSKVFDIIEVLKNNGEIRLQDIATKLNLNKSTVHRLVTELNKYNYIERNDETKRYRLGVKFLDISSSIIENLDIRDRAKKCIDELNTITKETIHLAMLLGNHAIYIDKKDSLHAIRMHSQIGGVAPLYCTGVGKAILAFQPPEILDNLINSIKFHKFTENTITRRDQLFKEIDEIKRLGYALDREEHEKNIICIAAPIRNYTKRVIASISITDILYRSEIKSILKYKDILLQKSNEISKSLGYS